MIPVKVCIGHVQVNFSIYHCYYNKIKRIATFIKLLWFNYRNKLHT